MENGNNVKMLYLHGMATKGRSRRIADQTVELLRQQGLKLELVTHNYPSHENKVLTGFRRDIEDLSRHVESVEASGVPKGRIGFLGTSYGSFLANLYLTRNDGFAFAILGEPYFGMQSLSPPLKALSKIILQFSNSLGRIKIPIKSDGIVQRYIDAGSLADFISTPLEVKPRTTPTLALITNYHSFFNRDSIDTSLETLKAERAYIDLSQPESEQVKHLTKAIYPFLRKLSAFS